MYFKNRKDAGIQLAEALKKYQHEDVIVYALPRGGVELGVEIANKLKAPLDLIITKKIGHPLNSEYAICAVGEESEPICNTRETSQIDPTWLHDEVERIRTEIKRRKTLYQGEIQPHSVAGKTAIVVDDGIATGLTMMAAIAEIKHGHPKKIVVAIPVTPYDTAQVLTTMADELVSLDIDKYFLGAIGAYYGEFNQVKDSEVIALLQSVHKK